MTITAEQNAFYNDHRTRGIEAAKLTLSETCTAKAKERFAGEPPEDKATQKYIKDHAKTLFNEFLSEYNSALRAMASEAVAKAKKEK